MSSATSRCSACDTTCALHAAGSVRNLVTEAGEAVEYGQLLIEMEAGRVTVALLFSPQGSQAVGMGRDLAEGMPAAAARLREADAGARLEVASVAWEGPEERLNETQQTQPCLVTTSVACLARAAASVDSIRRGPPAAFVAGHRSASTPHWWPPACSPSPMPCAWWPDAAS